LTEIWLYGNLGRVKTTLEMPDDLMRRIKMRAVQRNQKLKDAIAQLLEAGIAAMRDEQPPARAPKPVRLKKRRRLTIGDIEDAIAAGRS
jgi:hypothetical protein